MQLPRRLAHPGLPAALREARETYRQYSGAATAPPSAQPAPEPSPPLSPTAPVQVAEPRGRSLVKRAKDVARPLREHLPSVPVRGVDPDVVLDVPKLHVDEIDLKLDALKARVALEARVLDLLRLDVGVEAELGSVELKISGVDAEAHLRVRLDNLTVILDRVMNTVDRNPQLLERLADRLGDAVGGIAQGAGTAVGELGRGAGSAVEEIGGDAGSAVRDVGGVARALAPDTTRGNGGPAT